MIQIPHPSNFVQEAPKTKPRHKPLKKFEGLIEQEERFVFPEPQFTVTPQQIELIRGKTTYEKTSSSKQWRNSQNVKTNTKPQKASMDNENGNSPLLNRIAGEVGSQMRLKRGSN